MRYARSPDDVPVTVSLRFYRASGRARRRYQCFADQKEFEQQVQRKQPHKIDIGAVFTLPPKVWGGARRTRPDCCMCWCLPPYGVCMMPTFACLACFGGVVCMLWDDAVRRPSNITVQRTRNQIDSIFH